MVSGWLPPISAFLQTHRYFVVGVIRQACPERIGAWCVAAFTIKTSWGAVSFFIFSSALRNRRAGSVWSCAVVLHFEAVQELSGPRASKLIRVPERMRSFCNYFGHVDRSFPVGRRDSYLWQYLELPSERLEGCKNISGMPTLRTPGVFILHARHVLLDCHENIRNDLFFFFAMCVCGIDAARMQRGSDRGLRECTMLRLSACNSQWDE